MTKRPGTDLPTRKICLDLYRTMVRVAAADNAIKRGLSAGDIQFQYYPCGGQEAIAAGISAALSEKDYLLTTYRGIHDIVAKGTPMREIMAELYGRVSGASKGKGGPMHLSDPAAGLMMTTGIVGAGLPVANGLALAAVLRGEDRVTAVCFGDGASSIGAFHEALNLAALWSLPVIFICQNNQYAEYTALRDYTRNVDIAGPVGRLRNARRTGGRNRPRGGNAGFDICRNTGAWWCRADPGGGGLPPAAGTRFRRRTDAHGPGGAGNGH